MTKEDILRYVAKTPHNTNPNMIGNMIDALVGEGGGGSMPKDYPLNNKNVLFNDTVELSLDSEIYVFDSLNPNELSNYSITINNKQAESMSFDGMPVYGIETQEGIIALVDGRFEGFDGVVAFTNYDAGLVSIQVAEPAVDIDFLKGVKAALRTDHILTTGEEICNQKDILPTQDGESDYYFLNLGTVDLSTLMKAQGQELTLTLVEHFEGESTLYTTKLQFEHGEWFGALDNGQGVYLYFNGDDPGSITGFLDYEGINSEATYDVKVDTSGTALATVEEGIQAAAENPDLFSSNNTVVLNTTRSEPTYSEWFDQQCFKFTGLVSALIGAEKIKIDITQQSGKKTALIETTPITFSFTFITNERDIVRTVASNDHIVTAYLDAYDGDLYLFLDPIETSDYYITITTLGKVSPAIQQGTNAALQSSLQVPPQPLNENEFLISTVQSTPQFALKISDMVSSSTSGGRKRVLFNNSSRYVYSLDNPGFQQLSALTTNDVIYLSLKDHQSAQLDFKFIVEINNVYGNYSSNNYLQAEAENGDLLIINATGMEISSEYFQTPAPYGNGQILTLNKTKDQQYTSKWITSTEMAQFISSSAMKVIFTYNSGSGWQCNYSMNQILTAYQNNAVISAVATGGPSGPANLYGYNFDTTIEYPLSLVEVSVTDNYQHLTFYFKKPQMPFSDENMQLVLAH